MSVVERRTQKTRVRVMYVVHVNQPPLAGVRECPNLILLIKKLRILIGNQPGGVIRWEDCIK